MKENKINSTFKIEPTLRDKAHNKAASLHMSYAQLIREGIRKMLKVNR